MADPQPRGQEWTSREQQVPQGEGVDVVETQGNCHCRRAGVSKLQPAATAALPWFCKGSATDEPPTGPLQKKFADPGKEFQDWRLSGQVTVRLN